MTDTLTPDQVLDAAADRLENGRWGTGRWVIHRGRDCAVTAINAVTPGITNPLRHSAREALIQELGLLPYALSPGDRIPYALSPGDRIIIWNDAQRDKRKVIRALRRTARKLRGAAR